MVEAERPAGRSRVGRILCMLPAIYLSGIVGYALFNFSAFASTPAYFTRYVVAPGLMAAGLIWLALRGSPSVATTVGINVFAIFFALFLFEGVASVRILNSISHSMAEMQRHDDLRESLPMNMTLGKFNQVLGTKRLQESMLGGVPGRRLLKCINTVTGPVTYKADRYGFNNPDLVYNSKAIDVLLLGDSFIEGVCLKQGNDVAGVLRANGLAAVTLGMRGNGPLMELAGLGRFGPQLKPKHAFIVYFAGNDWTNLRRETATPWLREGVDANALYGSPDISPKQMVKVEQAIEAMYRDANYAPSEKYKWRIARNFFALAQTWSALGLHYPELPKPQPVFNQILAQMHKLVEQWDGRITLVYVPPAERFTGALPHGFAYDAQRNLVLSAAAGQKIEVIDLAKEFPDRGNPTQYYGADGHFSDLGAALVASLIADRYGRTRTLAADRHLSRSSF